MTNDELRFAIDDWGCVATAPEIVKRELKYKKFTYPFQSIKSFQSVFPLNPRKSSFFRAICVLFDDQLRL